MPSALFLFVPDCGDRMDALFGRPTARRWDRHGISTSLTGLDGPPDCVTAGTA
jgi:hypothetical protein